MAVSYLSQTFHSSPYVLPLDLGLFSKVMGIKQQEFNEGQAKEQQQIDQFGALDVLKDSDRQYLNTKINNIVQSVNGLGGVDFSDMNTLNQIEGLGSDIYGDNNIITAVSSTKSVRNLISSYHQFKTDPKLSKMYSEVNEALDLQKVNSWANDGKVGTSYNGPSSATPYTPYRDNHFKLFQNMTADMRTEITDKGLFYVNKEGQYIRPERIMQAAADLLTPQERAQMKRDGTYLYTIQGRMSPTQIVNKGLTQYDDRVQKSSDLADEYEALAQAASGDPKARANYNMLAINQRREVDALKAQRGQATEAAIKSYQQDPEEFMYQIYSNDYFRGLGNRFSVNKEKTTIQADQAEMFKDRMEQADKQFGVNTGLKEAELALKEREVATKEGELDFKYWEKGFTKGLDPNDRWSSTNINTQDPGDLKMNESSLTDMNKSLQAQKSAVHFDFLNQIAQDNPALVSIVPSAQSPTGLVQLLKGQEVLENYNGQPGFQMEDLGALGSNSVKGQLQAKGLDSKQIEYLSRLYSNYQDMRNGKPPKFALPKGFDETVKNINMIDERIRANTAKIQAVNSAVYDGVLTPQEQQLYTDYNVNPDKYITRNAVGHTTVGQILKVLPSGDSYNDRLDDKIVNIKKKIEASGVDLDSKKAEYYKKLATRDVFNTRVFASNDPDVKNGEVQRFIYEEISSGRVPGVSPTNIEVKNINPVSTAMSADGTGQFYLKAEITTGEGNNKESRTVKVPISDKNAARAGMTRDPYSDLNYSVNISGKSGELPIYGGPNGLAASVKIYKKNPQDLNDYSSYAKVIYYHLDQNGQPIPGKFEEVNIPAAQGRTPSEAYALAETFIKKADANKISYQDLKQWLYNQH